MKPGIEKYRFLGYASLCAIEHVAEVAIFSKYLETSYINKWVSEFCFTSLSAQSFWYRDRNLLFKLEGRIRKLGRNLDGKHPTRPGFEPSTSEWATTGSNDPSRQVVYRYVIYVFFGPPSIGIACWHQLSNVWPFWANASRWVFECLHGIFFTFIFSITFKWI